MNWGTKGLVPVRVRSWRIWEVVREGGQADGMGPPFVLPMPPALMGDGGAMDMDMETIHTDLDGIRLAKANGAWVGKKKGSDPEDDDIPTLDDLKRRGVTIIKWDGRCEDFAACLHEPWLTSLV